MPRRHRPYRPKVKGCYECSQRRINCDRGEPECRKCISKRLKCSGLGIRHRFNDGIAARGKWAGRSVQSVYSESVYRMQNDNAIEPLSSSKRTAASGLLDLSSSRSPPRYHDHENHDQTGIIEQDAKRMPVEVPQEFSSVSSLNDGLATSEPTSASGLEHPSLPRPGEPDKTFNFSRNGNPFAATEKSPVSALLQPTPANIPLWKKILLLNFSENIAKEMVAIDGLHNGWRHLVLPIAHTDELVMNAVLAVSAFHLSVHEARSKSLPAVSTQIVRHPSRLMNHQQHPDSDSLYAHTIMGLQQRQELGMNDGLNRHMVLLALLILLVGVMVTGSEDFPILFRMLQSALEVIGGEKELGTGDLAEFMTRQIRKMRFYAAPLLSEKSGLETLSSPEHTLQAFECMNYCSQQRPDAAAAVPLIASLVQQAHDIYLRQALLQSTSLPSSASSSTAITPSASDSIVLVQRFKETLEAFPQGSPGEQVLIWATFIAASDCVLDEHKAFFEDALLRCFVRSGFVNVLSGLEHLRRIWAARGRSGDRWTSLLPQARVFVM